MDLRVAHPDLRWSAPDQWHVTLQFLGQTSDAWYDCIRQHLSEVREQTVQVELAEPGFFERAGVFHVEVKLSSSLLALHKATENALGKCGFEAEARPYSPHITLARKRGRSRSAAFEQLRKHIGRHRLISLPPFTAHEFLLYESVPGPSGSRYEVRERFPLM